MRLRALHPCCHGLLLRVRSEPYQSRKRPTNKGTISNCAEMRNVGFIFVIEAGVAVHAADPDSRSLHESGSYQFALRHYSAVSSANIPERVHGLAPLDWIVFRNLEFISCRWSRQRSRGDAYAFADGVVVHQHSSSFWTCRSAARRPHSEGNHNEQKPETGNSTGMIRQPAFAKGPYHVSNALYAFPSI